MGEGVKVGNGGNMRSKSRFLSVHLGASPLWHIDATHYTAYS